MQKLKAFLLKVLICLQEMTEVAVMSLQNVGQLHSVTALCWLRNYSEMPELPMNYCSLFDYIN